MTVTNFPALRLRPAVFQLVLQLIAGFEIATRVRIPLYDQGMGLAFFIDDLNWDR